MNDKTLTLISKTQVFAPKKELVGKMYNLMFTGSCVDHNNLLEIIRNIPESEKVITRRAIKWYYGLTAQKKFTRLYNRVGGQA